METLAKYYAEGEVFPSHCYVFGHKSVGKSMYIKRFLESSKHFIDFVVINVDECYINKILFETIINRFNNHELTAENNFSPYAKIDSMEDFLNEISQLQIQKSYVIVIEKAEKLRDMEVNVIPTLMKLQEFTGLNISTIFVSHLAFEKFGAGDSIKIHIPDYSKGDILEILLEKHNQVQENVLKALLSEGDVSDEKLELVAKMDIEFYKNYLNIFLNLFFKICRDLVELTHLSNKYYPLYYTPVLNGEIVSTDVTSLWRHITKLLKLSLTSINLQVENLLITDTKELELDENVIEAHQQQKNKKAFAQMLELPYYAKYLLVASFLASHNEAKSDKKLFLKNHGKEKKKKNLPKTADKMNVQFGPKSFTIDRLLAIFYAILEEKVGLTCNLLSQISTLIDLNFISFSSGENNIMEGTARLQSSIGLEFAINIGKVIGFNVKQYLTDFH